MANPVDIGQINAYAGDPLTLVFTFQDQDYTGKTFKAQIRDTPGGTLKVEWTVNTAVISGTTVVTLSLTGDSVFGTPDGQTRSLGNKAGFDLQRINTSDNKPEETMLTGTVLTTQDYTK